MSDENPKPSQYPLGEPSVLDYFKSLLRFGDGGRIKAPFEEEVLIDKKAEERRSSITGMPRLQPIDDVQRGPSFLDSESTNLEPVIEKMEGKPITPFPWRSLLAFGLALIGQKTFEPPHTSVVLGFAFYIAAFVSLGWALYHGEWRLPALAPTSERADPQTFRGIPLFLSIGLALVGFYLLKDNLFTRLNVIIWILAIVFLLWAFWLSKNNLRTTFGSLVSFFERERWTIHISRLTILLLAATALILFFRFYQTTSVPPEPFSDHAEKILDVYDVSQGQTHIFFPRNTGREGFQMYWTVLIAKIFGTGLSFLSLKLGTAILGFLTLPFVYLLGKEIGGPRVGLFAFILTGIGYWPNLISRVGLRFPLYPLFAAPTLLYLIRGLRTRNRNDFLLSGLFLGIGLHGYSPMRIVPFVVVAAFVLYWLHSLRSQSKGVQKDLLVWLVMLALVALFVFLPLLRYWLDNPAVFSFRAFTRLGSIEQPLPGPAYQIFFSNLWNALRMFNYDDGEIWVNSVTHRPALDVVTAALFLIGVILILIRYIRNRHWLDLFLLASVPLLLMPSILSLAFPGENPALNRGGGGYIPAFLIAALALDGLLTSFGRGRMRSILLWVFAGSLLYFSASQNFDLVFNQYYTSFRQGSWNSSDMGKVIKEFEQTNGQTDTAWIVPFPYWVDTRLPAVWAGIPNRDMAMWRENLPSTVEFHGPKLFIVKADVDNPQGNDQQSLDVLKSLYPNGQLRMFDSDVPGHDFWIFTVPGN
ncbi:MAG TPA: glycosyltransferase family 39 protein [Anaerolineales bacterium]|nr:glycosyltransferase family 39 protein [Anaerolineales bacterium]HLO32026.1 glycosyltransferase family 39 protein [Anaerolineales bacterium]